MALLEMGGRRFTLPQGEVLLGADPSSAIPLAVPGVLPKHAKLKSLPDGQVVITKAVPEADVLINGVRLGAEPTPLLHGDKVEVAGQELTFVDERRSGSTQYVQAMNLPQAMERAKAEAKGGAGGKVTVNTGGRVVSLTDGREYAIAGASLVFGRDASCDVVVTGKDVSRRHAEIMQTPKGYLLVDSSTNGTSVNDARVEGQRLLARADVITIGDEKFRFYADTAAPAPPSPPPASPQPGPAASAPSAAPPAAPKGERLRETVHGVPAAPRPSGAPLASLLVRGGALKGQRLGVKTPVVNIGRADYNDLVLPDESVSTAHAKLQRREGVWVLVDLDSTNGTFIDGDQIKGEAPLAPGATVRFGDISLVFEPTDEGASVAKGGGTRVMEQMIMSPPPTRPAPAIPAAPAKPAAPKPAAPKPAAAKPAAAKAAPTKPKPGAKPAPPVAQQKKGKGCGGSAAVLLLGIVGLAYWLFI
jgi:pSer/pThr/pTyr-binding forkhead associated (FHA) protein